MKIRLIEKAAEAANNELAEAAIQCRDISRIMQARPEKAEERLREIESRIRAASEWLTAIVAP